LKRPLRRFGGPLPSFELENMKLPADTIIARRKVTEYLLRHRAEDDKSAFLA
jgi:hypothetical protein